MRWADEQCGVWGNVPIAEEHRDSSHMGVLLLFLQVQTLYYSADHKLLDGNLLDGQAEVYGSDDDHIQFVQVQIAVSLR